jgi:hypothetical protein
MQLFGMDVRLVALLLMVFTNAVFAQNPFVKKFGGPYPNAGPSFKQGAAAYGSHVMGTLSVLGKEALQDKAGFAEYVKGEIDPRLQGLKATTPEEEKMKAAAVFVKAVLEAQVEPAKFKAEELKEIEEFMNEALPKGEEASLANRLGWVLIRYQEFVIGKTLEQLQNKQKACEP